MTSKSTYIQGETAVVSVDAAAATSAYVVAGLQSYQMEAASGLLTAKIPTAGMAGTVRYAVFANQTDGTVVSVETGKFTVRTMVSKYRAVVAAIDEALQGVAKNGKYSISVGEISITDKTFAEMLSALSYFKSLAEEEEDGESSSGKVGTIQTRFA